MSAKKKPAKKAAKPAAADARPLIGLIEHPRAKASVARTKSLGGIAGFLLGGAAALLVGEPATQALARALAGGVIAYLVTWAAAVAVWRQLLVAEARGVYERATAARREPEPDAS